MLMRGEDVQLCDSCGRYLYLPDPAESRVPCSRRGCQAGGEGAGQAPETQGAGACGLSAVPRRL